MLLYTAAGLAGLASLKTKENAFTLPVVVVMYDAMFLRGFLNMSASLRKWRRIIASLSGLLLVVLAIAIHKYDLHGLFEKFKATNEISRHDYLVTQFRVIVTYIRLLFIPVNQTVDHHYKVYSDVLEPSVIASLAFIVLLACSALYLLRVSRDASPYLRLVSFGIFWFFITLSVESSVIPLIDVMFEHRLYLPSIGAILAVTAVFVHALENMALTRGHLQKSAACMLAIAVIALSYAAYARNRVWKNELTLWSDAIAKKPLNPRGYNMVGIYYLHNFKTFEAIHYFRKALEVDSMYAEARSNLGNAYIQTGRIDEGLNELMTTAKSNRFDAIDTGILYYSIGKCLHLKGMSDQAIENLNMALFYIPNEAAVYFLLGEVYKRKNLADKSAASFKTAHDMDSSRF
ncbi:MAG: tetratricopeptide repeat protein [Desulfuromonadaceae bacterium]